MPTPRDFLKMPLSIPRALEAGLPAGMPRLSNALSAIVDALPLPQVPAIAARGIPGRLGVPRITGVTDFIKGIQSALPGGLQPTGGLPRVMVGEGAKAPSAAPRGIVPLVFE